MHGIQGFKVLQHTSYSVKSLSHSLSVKVGNADFFCRKFFSLTNGGQSGLEEDALVAAESEASSVVISNICCFIHYLAKCTELCRLLNWHLIFI
jgi:hypothetical protein